MDKEKFISLRISEKDLKILEVLMDSWGENQTQTIKRALQIAYDLELELGDCEKTF